MVLKLGIAIGTSLLLASAQQDTLHACTSYTDLAEPCGCAFTNDTFDPQCGSDGQTYLNACFFECRKAVAGIHITVAYTGVCENEFKCECYTEYKPVCGSNGVTYTNECTLKCSAKKDSSIRLNHNGVCVDGAQRLKNPKPDGKQCPDIHGKCRKKTNLRQLQYYYSYEYDEQEDEFLRPSSEFFVQPYDIDVHIIKSTTTEKRHTEKGHTEKRHTEKRPDVNLTKKKCVCAELHRPVCGSNHKTYPNFCVFYCVSKKEQALKLAHWGGCPKTDVTTDDKDTEDVILGKECMCAAVHRPICANNNKTYSNLCVFLCDSKTDQTLHFSRWGPCENSKAKRL